LNGALQAADPRKKQRPERSLAERAVILYSRGIRGVLTSVAFLVITAAMITLGQDVKNFWLIPLTLALVVLAGSISRFVQASGYKKLAAKEPPRHPEPELGTPPLLRKEGSLGEGVPPARSFYDTDDLAATPFSVTERTTSLLHRIEDKEDLSG